MTKERKEIVNKIKALEYEIQSMSSNIWQLRKEELELIDKEVGGCIGRCYKVTSPNRDCYYGIITDIPKYNSFSSTQAYYNSSQIPAFLICMDPETDYVPFDEGFIHIGAIDESKAKSGYIYEEITFEEFMNVFNEKIYKLRQLLLNTQKRSVK